MIIKIKNKQNNGFENMLALYINLMMMIDMIRRLFELINLKFNYDTQLQASLYILLFIGMFIKKYRDGNKLIQIIIGGLVSCLFFLYGYLMEPQVYPILLISILSYFTLVFGTCIFVKEIKDPKLFIDCCKKYVFLSLPYCLIVLLTQSEQEFALYSMSFSFNCFFSIGLALVLVLFEKKKIYLLVAVIDLVINMMIGSRSIIIYALAVFMGAFLYLSKKKYYAIYLVLFLSLFLLIFNYDLLESVLGVAIIDLFPESRTIEMIYNGRLFALSGREIYYDIIESAIMENPFVIHGVLTDRILIGNSMGHTSYITEYPHNILLEVFYQHGVVIGAIFFMILILEIVLSLKKIQRLRDQSKWVMALMILAVSYATCQLLVSNSYIISSSFGFLIGMMLNIKNLEREQLVYGKKHNS